VPHSDLLCDNMHNKLACLFCSNTILVVVEMFTTKQKRKLWIIFLLLLCHMLKFWAIACNKICKLVNNVLQLYICNNLTHKLKCHKLE